jgi:hypothetical protein
MAIAERVARVASTPEKPSRPRLGRAFGLDVQATYDIPALGSSDGRSSARRSICSERSARELEREWPEEGSEHAVELRYPDGRLFMSIRSHAEAGYRIWAPRHGRHLVSADGREIRSALPRRASLSWQRLFFAQTLPLAAALQGLEMLHASAVGLGGRAIAFTAASGTGKSSLAAHLVASGATFLTDDVLALERVEDGVLAHPGPARASVSSQELRSMTPLGRRRLGPQIGSTDKPQFEPAFASAPLPLAILYRVSRSGRRGAPRLHEHVPPEPRLVLGSCFLSYLSTPERLLNQLSVCEGVTSSVRMFDLEIPAAVSAQGAAAAVLEHAGGVLAE